MNVILRILLALGGGLIAGAVCWLVGGIAFAVLLSKPHGPGGSGILGMLVVGPILALAGFTVTAWLLWRLTANAPRMVLAIGLLSMAGFVIAMVGWEVMSTLRTMELAKPNPVMAQLRGNVLFEVRFPEVRPDPRVIGFQFSKAAGGLRSTVLPQTSDNDPLALAAAMPIQTADRRIAFAVMVGGSEWAKATVELPSRVATNDWSPWKPIGRRLEMRWRLEIDGR